jgi:hypothetical protein
MKNILFSLTLLSLFVTGCEESSSSFSYEKQIVVTALIEAGRPIDTLKLVYTGEVDKVYNTANYAVTNAVVTVTGVDVAFTDTLIYDPLNPGRYHSASPVKLIQPTKTYRLNVTTSDGKTVTAVTTVPDTFSMVYSNVLNNSILRYNPKDSIRFFVWSPSRFHGTYLPTITSVDSNAARIPKSFIRDTVSNPKPDKIGYRVGLPREQNYTEVPWIVLNYFGTTRFDVYAIDENYTQFLNQYVTTQGGELAGIRYNVQGGIGFFGARTLGKGSISTYLVP